MSKKPKMDYMKQKYYEYKRCLGRSEKSACCVVFVEGRHSCLPMRFSTTETTLPASFYDCIEKVIDDAGCVVSVGTA